MAPHVVSDTQLLLVVDDFGVNYVGKEHAEHLIKTLKEHDECSTDWKGNLYGGIQLDWNYNKGFLNRYVQRLLQKFQHEKPPKPI